MSSKSKANPRFSGGKKIRSIYSPGYHGTRVPDGKPGNQRPLLDGDNVANLFATVAPRRMAPAPPINPETGEEWTDG